MSQDLLSEFGSFSIDNGMQNNATPIYNPSISAATNQSKQPGPIQHLPTPAVLNAGTIEDVWAEDDEDFGDFEAAGQELDEDPLDQEIHQELEVPEVPQTASAKNIITAPDFKPKRSAKELPSDHPFAGNLDVLFDAEDSDGWFEVDDDDEFGAFESTAPPVKSSKVSNVQPRTSTTKGQQAASFDLLGLDEEETRPPPSQGSKKSPGISSSASVTAKPYARKEPPQPRAPKPQAQLPPVVTDDEFTAWDDFESVPAQTAQPPQPAPTQTRTPEAGVSDLIKLPTELIGNLLAQAPNSPPPAPSNIPPPSLLLSLFPSLFIETSTHFLHPLATLSAERKLAFLTSTPTQTFLKNYLTATHVLSHIIAGRKNRWKRDKFLAQSMRIGPSVSGRSGGMKLAGLDTNESRREDSEVEDVLRVWREQLGRLRSAMTGAAGAKRTKKAMPVVPELASVMPVRVAKQAEGGVVSTAACALCGLKREERVAKVDVEVEDSFGEWWVEKTNMHLRCFNFWEEHHLRLRGR